MLNTRFLLATYVLLICTAITATALAKAPVPATDLPALAQAAVAPDAETADAAIKQLRAAGPAGLEALFEVHAAEIQRHGSSLQPEVDETWERISAAINAVAGQHDAHAARLYWYTDLDAAKAAAQAAGKPILALRMLGKLTEECSCANSRFFRTTLYANHEISKVLREQFILHWKSVRPVPKVTIDFGDGRVLERTLTGNSIHYVLDFRGRLVDAIPGLYGPKAFLRQLQQGRQTATSLARYEGQSRDALLRTFHDSRHRAVTAAWAADLKKAGVEPPKGAAAASRPAAGAPTAAAAARVTISKMAVEVRLINEVAGKGAADAEKLTGELEQATTEEVWNAIARSHAGDATLDAGSVALMREHHPSAVRASRVAPTKREVESPLLRMISNFQNSIALDTVRNEYLIHRRIHQWFAAGEPVTTDVDKLNQRVYAELFLTPDSDPWLGLASDEVYTGLREHGRR